MAVVWKWGQDRRGHLDAWTAGRPVIPCDTQIARIWGELAGAAQLRGRPGGRWTSRCDLSGERPAGLADFTPLWQDVSAITAPAMLVRRDDSKFVGDEDVAQFRSRMPRLRAEVVPGAGHAIQSDQPLALTGLIEEFVFG